MGKNHLRTSLIKLNYEDELGTYVPEVNYRIIDREIEDWYSTCWHRNRGRGHSYHAVNDVHPWTRTIRILTHFEGKPFAEAFAKFCAEGPVYQQHDFLENIDKKKDL